MWLWLDALFQMEILLIRGWGGGSNKRWEAEYKKTIIYGMGVNKC